MRAKLLADRCVAAEVVKAGRRPAAAAKPAASSSPTADEGLREGQAILGLDIKGHIVKKVIVASGAAVFTLASAATRSCWTARTAATWRVLAEASMDIKTLAKERPLGRLDPTVGIDAEVARHARRKPGFDEETAEAIAP